MRAIENKTPEELKEYFRSDSYMVNSSLLPEHVSSNVLFPRVQRRRVTLLKVKDPVQVEVTFDMGSHKQHSTLYLRDLFTYELDNREREYQKEEENLGRYVDFDAIRRNHNPKSTA